MSRLLPIGAVLLACGCAEPVEESPPVEPLGRPPVIVVLFDALDAGHLSHLGYPRPTTPELDRLATGPGGTSFSSAFSPAPYTVAGIPSILTGRRPDSHGVTNQAARLADDETTLAEYLSEAGYRTMGAIGNLNGGVRLGNSQGFDVFEELFLTDDPELIETKVGGQGVRLVTADLLVDFTRRMLTAIEGDERPPFLYLHVLEPHAPYVMPDEYRELWLDPEYDGIFVEGDIAPFVQSLNEDLGLTERDIEAAIALYDANLRYADESFGQIRALLEEAGIWDEALVLITSDHGEAFWQHGRWGHNDHLYDEQLHVPLIVKRPMPARAAQGSIRDELVSTIDLVPSICEWLNLPVGELPFDGRSFAPLVDHPGWTPPKRELLLRSHHTIAHLALRSERAKTIVERAEAIEEGAFGATTAVRHFDLTRDPGETRDLYASESGSLAPVVEQLETWGHESVVSRSERGVGMTRTELHMLKNLGYIEEVPARELSFDERARRVRELGFPEAIEGLTAESTKEEWADAVRAARAKREAEGRLPDTPTDPENSSEQTPPADG